MSAICEPAGQLTPRQRQIIDARARGRTYKEVADELSISVNTVKAHVSRIFDRMQVACTFDLLKLMQPAVCQHCPHCAPRKRRHGRRL